MNRKLILLSVLVLAGAALGVQQYLQWVERKQAAEARARAQETVRLLREARQQMLKDHEKLVAQARAWIDEYSGNSELLAKAAANIQQVLKADARNVAARIESARLLILTGHISYRNFRPGSLPLAEQELQMASRIDPKSAEVYVLLGHVLYLQNRSREALPVLDKAETMGTNSPWLHINRARALEDLNRWEEAEASLQKVLARIGTPAAPPARVLRTAHENLAGIYAYQRKLDAADKEYRAGIAASPEHAWGRGHYAEFLLFTRGDPDAAIVEAQKAIEIMDYGAARLTLAAACYAKWANLKAKAPAEAARYLVLGETITRDLSWIMTQSARSVSAGPAMRNLVTALMARGVSIDTKDENGDTGLTLAAYLGDAQSVAILLKLGANKEAADNSGQTALSMAANKGYVEVARLLVARGANVNSRDQGGYTPFFAAAINGGQEMMRVLISMKADINMPTNSGYTPLMHAAFQGKADLARFLLQAGADPTPTMLVKDQQQSAADLAASRGHQELAAELRAAAEKRTAARKR